MIKVSVAENEALLYTSSDVAFAQMTG